MSNLVATITHSNCHCNINCNYIQSDITVTCDGEEVFYHEHTDFTVFKTSEDVRKYLAEHYRPNIEILDENIWGLLN